MFAIWSKSISEIMFPVAIPVFHSSFDPIYAVLRDNHVATRSRRVESCPLQQKAWQIFCMQALDEHVCVCIALQLEKISDLLSLRRMNSEWQECVWTVIKFQIQLLCPMAWKLHRASCEMLMRKRDFKSLYLWHAKLYGICVHKFPGSHHVLTHRRVQHDDATSQMILGRYDFKCTCSQYSVRRWISRRHVELVFDVSLPCLMSDLNSYVCRLHCCGRHGCEVIRYLNGKLRVYRLEPGMQMQMKLYDFVKFAVPNSLSFNFAFQIFPILLQDRKLLTV